MKFSITISKLILYSFLSLFFLTAGPSFAGAAPVVGKDRMAQLFEACRADWSLYLRRLTDMHSVIGGSLKQMSEKEYNTVMLSHDPALLLAQVTWPELFDRDGFGGFFGKCAELHADVRTSFNSKNASLKKRALEEFDACLDVDYGNLKKSEPFRWMLACYGQHARN